MRVAAAIGLSLFVACGTSAPRSHVDPELQLVQLSSVADSARNISGGIPVQYRLTIHNTTNAPLQLKRIDLQSMGYGAYTLPPFSRSFDQTIDAGAIEPIELWSSATIDPTITGANGPVTIRAVVQFDSSAGRFQTIAVQQVHANGSL